MLFFFLTDILLLSGNFLWCLSWCSHIVVRYNVWNVFIDIYFGVRVIVITPTFMLRDPNVQAANKCELPLRKQLNSSASVNPSHHLYVLKTLFVLQEIYKTSKKKWGLFRPKIKSKAPGWFQCTGSIFVSICVSICPLSICLLLISASYFPEAEK